MDTAELHTFIQKTDPCFYNLPSTAYHLTVGLHKNALQYAVFDAEKNKFVAFAHKYIQGIHNKNKYFEHFGLFVSEHEMLQLPYIDVRIVYETQQATLVPDALFDASEAATFLRFNQQIGEEDEICYDKLRNNESANIFAVPNGWRHALNIPQSKIHHHASVFIESLQLANKHSIKPHQVYIQVHATFFDMMVLDGRKLMFYNTFTYRTAEDFMYFVLFVYEQLKMSPEQTGVVLMGEIVEHSALYDLLYKYIRSIAFVETNLTIQNSHILNDVAPHVFYSLLNTVLCEL